MDSSLRQPACKPSILRTFSLPRWFNDLAHVPYMISAVGTLAPSSRLHLSCTYDHSRSHYLWAPGVESMMDKASAANDHLYSGLISHSPAV